jgi:amidase
MRGSILGVGTDIAGSIRVPALCCGAYGFKPTANANRVPYGGQASPGAAGSPGIIPCAGPLATSFRDLEFFMKTIIEASPWNYDSKTLCIQWRDTKAKNPLTIGVLPPDPLYPYTPPVARALFTAAQKLKAAGHNVIYIKSIPSVETAMTITGHMFSLDNTKLWKKSIDASGEPIVPSVLGTHFAHQDSYTLEDVFKLNVERQQCLDDWAALFKENKLDVVLGPGAETTAVPHDTYGIPPYTALWNILDYPSAIIPYLNADKKVDTEDKWPKGATRTCKLRSQFRATVTNFNCRQGRRC